MPNLSKPRILVVDDDPRIRESLGMLLQSAGYDVVTADNGVTAVAHLRGTVPDVLLTDINMPQMSGVELISHVRNLHPSVPIVAMSGDYHGVAVAAGVVADRFYMKGQPFDNLLTTIASLVATNPIHDPARDDRSRTALAS